MSGQDPANVEDGSSGQDPAGASVGAQASNDMAARVAQLEQEIQKRDAELSKVRNEAADRRVALRKEEEARQAALLEQGEYKALAESQAKQIEEYKAATEAMESLKVKAAAFDAWEARELESIEAQKAGLPPEAQAALDAAGSLTAKRAFLDALNVTKGPGSRVTASAGAGAAGSPRREVDFASLKGRQLATAIKQNPEAYWQQNGSQQKVGSILGRMIGVGRKE